MELVRLPVLLLVAHSVHFGLILFLLDLAALCYALLVVSFYDVLLRRGNQLLFHSELLYSFTGELFSCTF